MVYRAGTVWDVIAIAYTSQYQTDTIAGYHNGFHICLTAWWTGWADANYPTFMSLRNPNTSFNTLSAGLPSLDIAPNTNTIHNGVVAYTQETGVDGFGFMTSVYMTEISWPVMPIPVHTPIVPNTNNLDLADGMYPSIAINQDATNPTVEDASVTYMAQEPQSNVLHPYAVEMQLYPTRAQQWQNIAASDLPVIIGNYNTSDIPFINPGVSTAIVPGGNNSYWAVWCDRTELEPPPQTVWGSWGYAG